MKKVIVFFMMFLLIVSIVSAAPPPQGYSGRGVSASAAGDVSGDSVRLWDDGRGNPEHCCSGAPARRFRVPDGVRARRFACRPSALRTDTERPSCRRYRDCRPSEARVQRLPRLRV